MGTFGTPSSYNNTGALGSATNPTTAQGLSRDRENQKAILELPGTQAWVEKTITDGVIIPTSAEAIVLPEGRAPTDSLTTIALTSDSTTTLHEGMLIRLKAANSNTITVVHGTGANNISTIDRNNVVLDTTWYLELKLINGLWVQQETHAYKIANGAKITAETAATPATTTARGIGRIATLADMNPGVTVTNGPAFLDAATVKITSTPTAHAVPQANASGVLNDGWLLRAAPPGFSGFYAGDTPPDGWFEENGAELSRTTHARLFAIIGTRYGAGNGSTTFNLPDSRALVKRVWDNGRGIDVGRGLGTVQQDMVRSHNHELGAGPVNLALNNLPNINDVGRTELTMASGYFTNVSGGPENIVKNMSLMGIIKY